MICTWYNSIKFWEENFLPWTHVAEGPQILSPVGLKITLQGWEWPERKTGVCWEALRTCSARGIERGGASWRQHHVEFILIFKCGTHFYMWLCPSLHQFVSNMFVPRFQIWNLHEKWLFPIFVVVSRIYFYFR